MRTFLCWLTCAAIGLCAASCDLLADLDNRNGTKYEYLRDCIWVPMPEASTDSGECPETILNPCYPVFFTDKEMVRMYFNGEKYVYDTHFSYEIDKVKNIIHLVNAGIKRAAAENKVTIKISSLNNHHLTILYDGKQENDICLEREDFPEGMVATGTFPGGLLP